MLPRLAGVFLADAQLVDGLAYRECKDRAFCFSICMIKFYFRFVGPLYFKAKHF